MQITKAKREKVKVPILLMGASGSGKTLSALLVAKGMIEKMFPNLDEDQQWEKIGFIDTEHRRANLYVNTEHAGTLIGSFLKVDLDPPFTADKYKQAFEMLKRADVEIIIVDSLSSAWSGEGGILARIDQMGGGFDKWSQVTPDQRMLLSILMDTDVHVIATVRSKQGLEVTRNERGKTKIEKVGLKPEYKDGLEYEFAITFQLYENHFAEAMKDNSSLFPEAMLLSRKTGAVIYDWAEKGVDPKAAERERIQGALDAINKLIGDDELLNRKLTEFKTEIGNQDLTTWSLVQLIAAYKHLKNTAEFRDLNINVDSNSSDQQQTDVHRDFKVLG
ncbi:AAA family ATPase [Loigolactobacillus coryniformis]|uniref:AAA family ATPase n=1 Tax=Loigolactobacillus TaxID=2767889 RepID=UPI000F73F49A|nr:AAA family ATPase [Loigolactobacillus zhaoyuanensis]